MKHLKNLREQRAKASEEMNAIKALCEKENRSRTADEKTKWADLSQKIKDLDDEIKDFEAQEAEEARSAKPIEAQKPGEGAEQRGGQVVDLSIRAQVAAWVDTNKDAIKQIKNQRKADLYPIEIEFRAANSPMTPANTATNTITISAIPALQGGAPLIDLLRIQPTLWDLLPKGRTDRETFPWVNKKVPASSGAADFIGPGVAKPPVSFTLEVEKSNAKKVAVSMKVATELLDDVDGMASMISSELTYQLKTHINAVLMGAAAASATDPAGIRSFALPYSLVGVQTEDPNNWDAVRAAIAQMRATYVEGPLLILMNPVDSANMEMSKAISQGTYMGLNLRPVPGGFIVEDYNVAVGDVMIIALDYLKTLIYKDFRIAFGWENDDFTKNLVTAIAETRFHSFHSDNHAAGFFYDQLADIKSAIAIP